MLPAILTSLLLGLALPVQADVATSHRLLEEARSEVVPRYLLLGPNGQGVSHEDFRGRFQLIAFGYTYCPDICPTTLVDMAAILATLGRRAERIQPIFISVDPERDTSQVLKTYTQFFDARILGLTGSNELVRRAAQNFRVRYAKIPSRDGDPTHYAVDHSAGLYLLAPDGRYLRKFAFGKPVAEIADELVPLLEQR